jgi:hypothetical protein
MHLHPAFTKFCCCLHYESHTSWSLPHNAGRRPNFGNCTTATGVTQLWCCISIHIVNCLITQLSMHLHPALMKFCCRLHYESHTSWSPHRSAGRRPNFGNCTRYCHWCKVNLCTSVWSSTKTLKNLQRLLRTRVCSTFKGSSAAYWVQGSSIINHPSSTTNNNQNSTNTQPTPTPAAINRLLLTSETPYSHQWQPRLNVNLPSPISVSLERGATHNCRRNQHSHRDRVDASRSINKS